MWGVVLGAALALPPTFFSSHHSYEMAFERAAPFLNLVIVPIYVWRRVPGALLPKLVLSELVLWNVTATAVSFGAWAGTRGRTGGREPLMGLVLSGVVSTVWLWPTAVALVLQKTRDASIEFLKLPLVFYYWCSLLLWLASSLLEESSGANVGVLRLADAIFEAFGAIQCFAIVYLLYYLFFGIDPLDMPTANRVGQAIWGALQIDRWPPSVMIAGGAVYGVAVAAFGFWNAARGGGFPYWLFLIPYVASSVLCELSREGVLPPPMADARMAPPFEEDP